MYVHCGRCLWFLLVIKVKDLIFYCEFELKFPLWLTDHSPPALCTSTRWFRRPVTAWKSPLLQTAHTPVPKWLLPCCDTVPSPPSILAMILWSTRPLMTWTVPRSVGVGTRVCVTSGTGQCLLDGGGLPCPPAEARLTAPAMQSAATNATNDFLLLMESIPLLL